MSAEVSPELRAVLRRLKLSPLLPTLPERISLARQRKLPHEESWRSCSPTRSPAATGWPARSGPRAARLDPTMRLEAWDESWAVAFDRELWAELATLRCVEEAQGVLVVGPVGVGKTHLATALGPIACRRRRSAAFHRTDRLLKHLKAARLGGTCEAETRNLIRVDLLILDDFCLHALDATETADVYEIVVERHLRSSSIVTSNREPPEWLQVMADPLLAQSAIDRLQSAAYELVVEGESYRKRQKPGRRAS